jgi:transcriptional regulator with XRE-family HTH domain
MRSTITPRAAAIDAIAEYLRELARLIEALGTDGTGTVYPILARLEDPQWGQRAACEVALVAPRPVAMLVVGESRRGQAVHPDYQRRRLRAYLRREREAARLTQRDVAQRLGWSHSKLVRIEAGACGISAADLQAMLCLYGVTDPGLVAELTQAARVGRGQSWFTGYRDIVSTSFTLLFGYENPATSSQATDPFLTRGLLTTEEHAAGFRSVYLEQARVPRILQPSQERLPGGSVAGLSFVVCEERPGLSRALDGWTHALDGSCKAAAIHLVKLRRIARRAVSALTAPGRQHGCRAYSNAKATATRLRHGLPLIAVALPCSSGIGGLTGAACQKYTGSRYPHAGRQLQREGNAPARLHARGSAGAGRWDGGDVIPSPSNAHCTSAAAGQAAPQATPGRPCFELGDRKHARRQPGTGIHRAAGAIPFPRAAVNAWACAGSR